MPLGWLLMAAQPQDGLGIALAVVSAAWLLGGGCMDVIRARTQRNCEGDDAMLTGLADSMFTRISGHLVPWARRRRVVLGIALWATGAVIMLLSLLGLAMVIAFHAPVPGTYVVVTLIFTACLLQGTGLTMVVISATRGHFFIHAADRRNRPAGS